MSDFMLLGILRMPFETDDGNVAFTQFRSAARSAADRIEALTAERDAALVEAEQWRLSHGHLDQLAVDLSVRLISAGVWSEPMQEGEDGTEADYIACCANILEAVDRLTAERDIAVADLAALKQAIAAKGGSEHAPTQDAYDAACRALSSWRNRAAKAEAERDRLRAAGEKAICHITGYGEASTARIELRAALKGDSHD